MKFYSKEKLKSYGIEILFLTIALANIVFSTYLKSQAEKKFIQNDTLIYSLEISIIEKNNSKVADFSNNLLIEQFNNQFLTYTYFNKELEKHFLDLKIQLANKATDRIAFIKSLKDFNNQLKIENKRITFGYDSMIYSSLILIFISIILMIINNASQKKEIEKLNIHNEEQRKISRELHDGVAQDMSALLLFLDQNDIEKSKYAAKKALTEVRFMIGMQNIDLSEGFNSILRNAAKTFEQNYGIKTDFFSAVSENIFISAAIQLNLLRITQEALSNVAHHAKATYVSVTILEMNNILMLSVKDNGIGMQSPSSERKHYGLENINTRTQKLGGTFQIKSENGTTLLISVPVK